MMAVCILRISFLSPVRIYTLKLTGVYADGRFFLSLLPDLLPVLPHYACFSDLFNAITFSQSHDPVQPLHIQGCPHLLRKNIILTVHVRLLVLHSTFHGI